MLAAVLFPDIFQCRIMSPGRQCRVHRYTCTLVHVYKISDDPSASIIRVVNWSRDFMSKKTSHFMVTLGRTSNFTYFVQLHIHKIPLTKTQSLAIPLQLHFKSKMVSFFSFPLKHLNKFIIAHNACYEAHLLYPPWFSYANKTNNNYKCTISLYILSCVSLFPLSWHRQHNGRCVCEACYCLTEFATHMSRFGCDQSITLQHVYLRR